MAERGHWGEILFFASFPTKEITFLYLLMNVISKRKRNELSELLLGLENWRKVLLFFPFLLFFLSSFLSLAGYGFSLFSYKNVPTGLVLRLTVLI